MTVAAVRRWRRPPVFIHSRAWRWIICCGALAYLVLAVSSLEVSWQRLYEGTERGWRFIQGFLSPDFSRRWRDIVAGFEESLTMTVTSTVTGILVSVPIGIGAARNIAPRIVYMACRGIIALSRAFREIIVAILFVAMFGFGPFAGLLTLSFATIGFRAKLPAEDIEDIDESQAEAIRATGANWRQLINVALFAFSWQVMTKNTIWAFVLDAPRQAADLASRMANPRFAYLQELLWPLWETINIATLGTMLAIVIAVPLAFLAARNTTPSTLLVRPLALPVIVSSRSINSIIWGLLLVAIIGPGQVAGIFAIMLRSIGFIAKLLYEAIEEIDRSQVEAITATGATQSQVIDYGIVPQVLPAFAGISVFRWDINIRESTVLGLVGAGGLGLKLQASLNVLAWNQVTVIFIVILATVLVSEWVSARVRHAII